MREFKFRAWDTEREEMAEVISGVGDEEVTLQDEECRQWNTVAHYIAVIMQYTGLKDKNGTEIYEGDITTNELYRNESLAFAVYYDNEKGMFKQRPFIFKDNGKKLGDKDLTLQMDSVTNKEVIGNIYEHPHLLEE